VDLLTTLPDLKAYLKLNPNDTSQDTLLTTLIGQVSTAIENYLGRLILQNTYTEFPRAGNHDALLLRNRPITTITSVFLDYGGHYGDAIGAFPPSTELIEGNDFALLRDQPDGSSLSGMLIYLNGVWPRPIVRSYGLLTPFYYDARGLIKVIYTGGYVTVPPDIELATNMMIAGIWQMAPYGRWLTSESYEERSIGFAAPRSQLAIYGPAVTLLAKYKQPWF
jgi:hypothetical protein